MTTFKVPLVELVSGSLTLSFRTLYHTIFECDSSDLNSVACTIEHESNIGDVDKTSISLRKQTLYSPIEVHVEWNLLMSSVFITSEVWTSNLLLYNA